jgi:deoxyribonuclease V
MKACVDVDYRDGEALVACVLFRDWTDAAAAGQLVQPVTGVADYVPGEFYRRELPCLLAVLCRVADPIDLVVVDGYVWLADETEPGLGAHLYEALQRRVPVVGVAKTRFASARLAVPVVRGESATRPLFVTAVGMDVNEAAEAVRVMHGPHRIPTLLRQVDRLCRTAQGGCVWDSPPTIAPSRKGPG